MPLRDSLRNMLGQHREEPPLEKKLRVLGYVRVSSQEQKKGHSPEAQKEYIQAWCQREGWELVGIEDRDVGMPAESMSDLGKRPGLTRILNDPPGGYDQVMCWHNDRLSRDQEQLMYIHRILKKKGVKLVFANLPGVDFDTPTGRAMLQTSGVFAELEKGMIGLRVKLGKDRARKLGRHQGPHWKKGFIVDPVTKMVTPDPEIAAKVRELQVAGLNTLQIAKELEIPKSTAYSMVKRLALQNSQSG